MEGGFLALGEFHFGVEERTVNQISQLTAKLNSLLKRFLLLYTACKFGNHRIEGLMGGRDLVLLEHDNWRVECRCFGFQELGGELDRRIANELEPFLRE